MDTDPCHVNGTKKQRPVSYEHSSVSHINYMVSKVNGIFGKSAASKAVLQPRNEPGTEKEEVIMHLQIFLEGNVVAEKSEKMKSSTLLCMAGPKLLEILKWCLKWEHKGGCKLTDEVFQNIEEYFEAYKIITWKRLLYSLQETSSWGK